MTMMALGHEVSPAASCQSLYIASASAMPPVPFLAAHVPLSLIPFLPKQEVHQWHSLDSSQQSSQTVLCMFVHMLKCSPTSYESRFAP